MWRSYEQLHCFVYRSAHGRYLLRRSEWFDKIPAPATALWWVSAGHEPAPTEALARLQHLRTRTHTAGVLRPLPLRPLGAPGKRPSGL